MLHPEFLAEMEDILDMPTGSLTGSEVLAECEAWDSLAVLSFTVLASERFGRNLPPRLVRSAGTIDDLYILVSQHAGLVDGGDHAS